MGITRLADGKARIVIKGESGKNYRIEISKNLTDWSTTQAVQITSADGTQEFVDESVTDAVRFYRLALVP